MTQTAISDLTLKQAVARIGDAHHCQAGGTVALNAALAAALAQATANVTIDEGAKGASLEAAQAMQSAMAAARVEFLRIADQDADAITAFVDLRQRGEALRGYELLCDGPRELSDLAINATQHMQTFRAHVCERTQDDLEFAITQMVSAARAAMQLLDSNMRIWPLPELLARYDPEIARLENAISVLTPRARIRPAASFS